MWRCRRGCGSSAAATRDDQSLDICHPGITVSIIEIDIGVASDPDTFRPHRPAKPGRFDDKGIQLNTGTSQRANLIRQVQRNCDISDAQHAGLFSICGLALRLRDMCKWESNLAPWEEKDADQMLAWIDDREQHWEQLLAHDTDYEPLVINGDAFDPFDIRSINDALMPHELAYGAGYALGMKPSFFLGRVESRQRINGIRVVALGRELARDLLTLPALSMDRDIVIRSDAGRMYLWDQIQYVVPSGKHALRFALSECGIDAGDPGSLRDHLPRLLAIQKNTYLHHELGEIMSDAFDRREWRRMVSEFSRTPVELILRAVKDLLADTHAQGPLEDMIRRRDGAALGFYVAFIDGMHKALFPGLRPAFERFVHSRRWETIETAVADLRGILDVHVREIRRTCRENRGSPDRRWMVDRIQQRVLGTCRAAADG